MKFVVYKIRGYPYFVDSLTCPQVDVAGRKDLFLFVGSAAKQLVAGVSPRLFEPRAGLFLCKKARSQSRASQRIITLQALVIQDIEATQ